ncbi:Alpha/Beta hydrolase protein [Aspergillus cavernicola]|uniref:Carboxylic ester hydrolase n=1 Tax=Aspergillus cavernicola TaxID=176166 RepID=A0ABR4I6E3_9EURO
MHMQLPSGPILALCSDDENLIHARGIPYAQAQRFQPPQPLSHKESEAERDCTKPASICPQLPSRLESVMGPLTAGFALDENCLHLSITAPKNAKKAPVMMWLHGGAYISGGGDLPCYQPVDLARRGVVCVNVTYRLGVFGYLCLGDIAPANLGLLDQRAALRWIQTNISIFGGDPGNVTVVGQSAGADSIICLLVAQETKGLFHRAILLSPPLREIKERAPTASLLSAKAEQYLTKDPREMTVDELLAMQKKLLLDPVRKQVMLFAPSLGAYPLPGVDEFDQRVAEAVRGIPVLIGWTGHDGRPFSSMLYPMQILYKVPVLGPCLEALQTWFVTRSYFMWPSQGFHERVRRAGGTSTTYSFEWAGAESNLGACHCIDIPFVLGSWEAWKGAPMLKGKDTEEDINRLGAVVKDLWLDFMNGKSLTTEHIRMV